MTSLDIVKLIEKSPITKLSTENNNKLISKIQKNFTETQQQIFISSFYCYLNYNQTTDFVIDLDKIWEIYAKACVDYFKFIDEENYFPSNKEEQKFFDRLPIEDSIDLLKQLGHKLTKHHKEKISFG